jgi:hypothetical protein
MVGTALKKLVKQVAIRPVYLHAVKACQFGVLRTLAKSLHDARNLGDLKCPWRHIVSDGAYQAYVTGRLDGAGSNRKIAIQKARI